MDNKYYFEESPWDRACDFVLSDASEKIVAVNVQCVCSKGKSQVALQKWKKRLATLLGKCISEDKLENKMTISIIAKYENNVTVRLFIDDFDKEKVTNFEIVTTKSLLIWKPDVRLIGRGMTEDKCFVQCEIPYPKKLEEIRI